MNNARPIADEFWPLLDAACADELVGGQWTELQSHLESNPAARRIFVQHIRLRTDIRQWWKGERSREAGLSRIESECAREGQAYSNVGIRDSDYAVGAAIKLPHSPDSESQISNPPFPSLSPLPSPLSPNFVGGPVFSYMVATVILGVMLLGAWAYKISHFLPQVVETPSQSVPSDVRPELVFVGRISGMKECRWADPRTEAYAGASVPLNRRYALSSGLMEITYKTGAKVILEGPCTYIVESPAGGFLALGKLTANVDKRGEGRGARDEGDSHYPLSPLPSPLFFVRTPTAVITDLGTEFGVEVSKDGNTTSHVFRGSVRVQVVGDDLPSPAERGTGGKGSVVLQANKSARVEKSKGENGPRLVLSKGVDVLPKFVRRMVEPPKLLDLLDIVAGGRGIDNRRERGIDPATGKQDAWFINVMRQDDHGYHPVTWNRLVDGVFIPYDPSYKIRTVQLDSFGNAFGGFTEHRSIDGIITTCTIQGKATGSIWSRAADVSSTDGAWNRDGWIFALTNGEKYMPQRRGLLGLHANAGITFDLAAMREMYQDVRPARFRATTGMGDGPRKYPDTISMADLWVFVDGRLKWKRLNIHHQDGAIIIDVPLGPEDRFLTLVSTNGQHGQAYDWVVLGDPVLEMTMVDPHESLGESRVRETRQPDGGKSNAPGNIQ